MFGDPYRDDTHDDLDRQWLAAVERDDARDDRAEARFVAEADLLVDQGLLRWRPAVTGKCIPAERIDSRNAQPFTCSDCGQPIDGVTYFSGGYPYRPLCEGCYRTTKHRDGGGTFGYSQPDDVRLPHTDKCATCGRPIAFGSWSRSRLRERFCSRACRVERDNRRRRLAHVERDCASCGEPFTPSRSDGVFCSHACRQRAYRARKRRAG